MPSFQFVVPDSFLFISANLSFISFCFFISFIISKILKSNIIFFILLLSLLSTAYYDIFIKFAIQNYYSLSQMNSSIYTKPVKNEEGKIDSLSMVGVYIYPLKYSTVLTESEKEEIRLVHEGYVSKYIDISTYSYKFNRYISNTERVYLNSYKYNELDKSLDNEKPKFIISKELVETFLPKIFGKYEYKFVDEEKKIILGTAFNIFFINKYDKFRNKYLFWNQEKEDQFNLSGVQNFDIIYKDIFINNTK